MAGLKVFCFALLLVLTFSVDVEGYVVESGSLCCNSHPKFGKCNTNNDEQRCNSWCHNGCDNGRGGFCKPLPHGGQCHCRC
ncbi:Defensin-like protein 20-27 [Arabidopsis thaliana x Arabidopsis arenosa]|uniref:Defensin-like protein 20-27 n=2 Tax=Arabidopsis TaxID=3701 RepID=A0A8T1Z6M4_ARASU|nr:Defensin-like protein 20-27 [Arabidopsis thaliana x Arabidopsis arenosa]KAG7554576.1 Defensin-like protein 20-27 [Arabidopsis suecica]